MDITLVSWSALVSQKSYDFAHAQKNPGKRFESVELATVHEVVTGWVAC